VKGSPEGDTKYVGKDIWNGLVLSLVSGKLKELDKFFMGNPISELLAIWDHSVLLDTRHKRTHPALTPASNAGT